MTGDLQASESGRSEEVIVPSGDVTLGGSFVEVSDVRAAALILNGSGPLDRDSNTRVIHLNLGPDIVGMLNGLRIASLRFDKRGVGSSGGDYLSSGMTDNQDDAEAAIRWLVARCPGLPVFVIGHSEGALHAAELAAQGTVSGAVLIGCPARRGEDILTWQAAQIVPTLPRSTRLLLRLLHIDPLKAQQKQLRRIRSTSSSTLRVQGRKLNARWLREFMDFDPVPVLRRVRVPVLALTGAHDIQVPPQDAETIAELVGSHCDVEIIPDLSHILRSDPELVGPRAYRKAVRLPINPAVLETIGRWLDRRLGAPDERTGPDPMVTA